MVMENGGCLPDPPHHIPMTAPCLYWTDNHRFHDGVGIHSSSCGGGDGSRLNLCGSVDLMTDVLLHSSLLQETSHSRSINPITTDAGGAVPGAATTSSPELAPVPGSTSLDLPSIPPLQEALWWMMSSELMSAALAPQPADNNIIPTTLVAPQDATSGGTSSMTAPHLDVPVGSASRYLKDEAGRALASAILSHCAGNTGGAVDDSVGMWRSLMVTCNGGNAASSGDSEDSDMYGAAGSSPYANSGHGASVVDISFRHTTTPAQVVNEAAPIISSSHYLGQQLPAAQASNANRVACSDSKGQGGSGACSALLQYTGPNTSASTATGGASFSIDFENPTTTTTKPPKRPRSADRPSSGASRRPSTPSIDFRCADTAAASSYEPDPETVAQVKEMIYRAAAFRPVNLGAEAAVERPRRKNVRISSDPQTVAARHRRERISERLRVLQRLVPGGSKMDTASMLDEAANYLKFLKSQVSALEGVGGSRSAVTSGFKNAMNAAAASTGSCGGLPILPSSILATSSSLSHLEHGFGIPMQSTPKTIPSQLRDHSIELGNIVLH